MGRRIFYFLKTVEHEEYAEDFLNGKLFINRLSYFKKLEDPEDDTRGDKYEAAVGWFQPEDIAITIGDHTINSNELAAPVLAQLHRHDDLNVLCITAAHSAHLDPNKISEESLPELKALLQVPDKCSDLGSYSIIVRNSSEFIRRVKEAVESNNYAMSAKLVNYYDPNTFSGSFSESDAIFNKRNEFSYQQEYRFAIDTGTSDGKPISLNIGCIRDIAEICDVSQFKDNLVVSIPKK